MKTIDQIIDIVIEHYNILNDDIKDVNRLISRLDDKSINKDKRRIQKDVEQLSLKNKNFANAVIRNLRDMDHENKQMIKRGLKND